MKTYDVTISFAGDDRPTAMAIATSLHAKHMVRVFYDDYEQAALWGENLTEYLTDIYRNRASYCIVLISHSYVNNRWARHEWMAAQARAFEEFDRAYILPIRLDDADMPGFLPTIAHIDLRKSSLDVVIENIKIRGDVEKNKIIRLANDAFADGDLVRAYELVFSTRLNVGRASAQF